jgi:hypothetical protein
LYIYFLGYYQPTKTGSAEGHGKTAFHDNYNTGERTYPANGDRSYKSKK